MVTRKPAASILNDVLGPIMVGPSSSHTAGPARIGRMVHDLCGGIRKATIIYSSSGSYAATIKGQASDRGFAAGLLGWECFDPRLPESLTAASQAGISIFFQPVAEPFDHPNRAVIQATGLDGMEVCVRSLSLGGGRVCITEIQGVAVNLDGSRTVYIDPAKPFEILALPTSPACRSVRAVMPLERDASHAPEFVCAKEMFQAQNPVRKLSDFALHYESSLGNWNVERLDRHMDGLLTIMAESARSGLKIESSDHFQMIRPSARHMAKNRNVGIDIGLLNDSLIIATAVMEVDRDMGIIVAAPTAGSAGVLPAVLLPILERGIADRSSVLRGLLAAGLVGALIANQATFAAEEAGCQAENGSASAMAAAAICDILGASAETSLKAASLALSNLLGLICDPVAGGVEIPCISRNAMAASNAVSSANMVLAGFDPFIPFDEVVQAMNAVGRQMPASLRCTANGGLAATPTACSLVVRGKVQQP